MGTVARRACQLVQVHSSPVVNKGLKMSEAHFDEFEHYNYDQDKNMMSGHSGKQRTKKEASQHTNLHNPAGHERKICNKLMNAEKYAKAAHGPVSTTAVKDVKE